MKKFFSVQNIAGLGILTASLICLFAISIFIKIGPLTLNLTLVPIVVGSCIYGPFGGLFLGFVDGLLNLLVGETSAFMAINAAATIVMVILKTSLAGFLSGIAFKLLKKTKPLLATIIASVITPIVNTGVFTGFCFIFFMDIYKVSAAEAGSNVFVYFLLSVLGLNFLIELAINASLSSVIYTSFKRYQRTYK